MRSQAQYQRFYQRSGLFLLGSVVWQLGASLVFPLASETQTIRSTALSSFLQATADSSFLPPAADLALDSSLALSTAQQTQFQQVMQSAISQQLSDRPLPDLIQTIATYFQGAPYAAGLLDRSAEETLVMTLDQFDCVLFVETVLALVRGIAIEDYTTTTFAKNLEAQRYVNGEMNGYCSRLHYFSDWILDNQNRNLVTDLSTQLGGVPLQQSFYFMSQNWQSYPQLVDSQANYDCIVAREKLLSTQNIAYIPAAEIYDHYANLQPGDVIAIATAVPGLDVTHTGLVYQTADGNLGLIHAAPNRGVTIAADLQNYVLNVEEAIGILVARPVDPRPANSGS